MLSCISIFRNEKQVKGNKDEQFISSQPTERKRAPRAASLAGFSELFLMEAGKPKHWTSVIHIWVYL